ncbi:MAG: nucleotide exchange factor GrpE [Defluviitaleaceae bacterium]|nr:nucleotide exchange factor GrpE [Defluviitaleaceae bacterium]
MKAKKNAKHPKNVNEVTDASEINENEMEAEEVEDSEEEVEVLDPEAPATPDLEDVLAQAQDRHKRTLAEFDNFRKRTTKEMAARYDDGLRAAAEKLLPIVDNFQRAMNASENKEDNFYQGIALIARQLDNTLADIGIEPINDEPGTSFDHNIHHAVAHIEDDAYDQNVVVEVLQKGYKHRDKVLRPSMVKVAN